MVPELTAPLTPEDPEDIRYFSYDWENLDWSPWVSFGATREEFLCIPKTPGLYRIRPAGKNFLMYIGETGQPLHKRLAELRQELRRTGLMPWNDPHPEAPALWAWRDAEQFAYECSAAPLDASQFSRRGMESFLLCRYRQEYGASPLCTFGRFHPRYRRSTSRRENLRGGRLADGQKDNPAGGPGIPTLVPTGVPGDEDWMGLAWTQGCSLTGENIRTVPPAPGLFIIADAASNEPLSIGQSMNCAARLLDQSRKSWDEYDVQFSYSMMRDLVLPHNLRELKNDLVGDYFGRTRKAPEFQFRISR